MKNTTHIARTPITLDPRLSGAIEAAKERFTEQAAKGINEFDAPSVAAEIVKELNAAKREVVMKIIGLDNNWGKWEVDHCNGRESPITKLVEQQCREAIHAWLVPAIKEELERQRERVIKEYVAAVTNDVVSRLETACYTTSREIASECAAAWKADLMEAARAQIRGEA